MFATTNLKRAASVAYFLALAATAQETGSDACTDVHVFLSRGNNEPYPGRQGKLVEAMCAGIDSCDYEDIAFDNALEVEYCSAIEAGGKAGIAQITAYNKKCPDTMLVVSGYSQGAHVVGDILGGGGGVFFQGCTTPATPGLSPDSLPGSKIGAALLFGDTRHTASQSFNTLPGAPFHGLFPRTGEQLAGLNSFSGVLRDYCAFADPICAVGDGNRDTDVQSHLNYFDIYTDAAASWVKTKLGLADSPSPTSSSTTMVPSSSTRAPSSTMVPTSSTTSTSSSKIPTSSSEVSTSSANISTSSVEISTTSTSAPASASSSGSSSSSASASETSSTTSIMPSTILPEATATDSSAPTATPESDAGVIANSKLCLGLVSLAAVIFSLA